MESKNHEFFTLKKKIITITDKSAIHREFLELHHNFSSELILVKVRHQEQQQLLFRPLPPNLLAVKNKEK